MKHVAKQIRVRPLLPGDEAVWMRMRLELWPESDSRDAEEWAARQDAATLVAEEIRMGDVVGFAEVGKRPYADGCGTSPVGFLEGWFVSAGARGAGVGSALIQGAIEWARNVGLQELASDSLLEDPLAYRAHLSAGFEEVERSIKYRMAVSLEHETGRK